MTSDPQGPTSVADVPDAAAQPAAPDAATGHETTFAPQSGGGGFSPQIIREVAEEADDLPAE